jgi:ABC-2 type transport system permease protein
VHVKHVTYFVLVTFISLFAATRVLEARRWR